MNDSEIVEFLEMFPNLPDPTQYPKVVHFHIKMYQHIKKQTNTL